MGNHISHKLPNIIGKLVLSDGTVHELNQYTTVAELMLEHPQQVVIEFRSPMAGYKLTPLPADTKLDVKKTYLMLPMNRGRATLLSVNEARQVLLKANTVLRSKDLLSSTRILPLFARICTTTINIECSAFLHKKVSSEENLEGTNKLEVLLQSFDESKRPQLLTRQFSGKMWKPSLDTIEERTVDKKFHHKFLRGRRL